MDISEAESCTPLVLCTRCVVAGNCCICKLVALMLTQSEAALGRRTMYFAQMCDGNRAMHQLGISLHVQRFSFVIPSQAPFVVLANDAIPFAEALQSQNYEAIFQKLKHSFPN